MFMRQVDKIVDQKFRKVNEYKENLVADSAERGEKQKRIRFVWFDLKFSYFFALDRIFGLIIENAEKSNV